MSFIIYVLRNILWERANQIVWDRQHMYHTSKRNAYNSLVKNRKGGDILDAQCVGGRLTMKTFQRQRCEDTWHLWNAPRMYTKSHQTYVLNSETYFELPNLRFWQQRWRRSKSSGFSRCQPTHRHWRFETSQCLHLQCQAVQIFLNCFVFKIKTLRSFETSVTWHQGLE